MIVFPILAGRMHCRYFFGKMDRTYIRFPEDLWKQDWR
jgi:hypothetical protein